MTAVPPQLLKPNLVGMNRSFGCNGANGHTYLLFEKVQCADSETTSRLLGHRFAPTTGSLNPSVIATTSRRRCFNITFRLAAVRLDCNGKFYSHWKAQLRRRLFGPARFATTCIHLLLHFVGSNHRQSTNVVLSHPFKLRQPFACITGNLRWVRLLHAQFE